MPNLTSLNGNQDEQGRARRASPAPVAPPPPPAVPDPSPAPPAAAPLSMVDAVAQPQTDSATSSDVTGATEQELADHKKYCQEQHDRYTSHLWDQRNNSQTEADKLVIALAGTTLALSVGVLKDVVPLAHDTFLPLLFTSWACLGASLSSTLVSYHMNLKNVDEHLSQCKAYFLDEDATALDKVTKDARKTLVCNKVSAFTFISGLILSLSFIGINVQREHAQVGNDNAVKVSQPNTPKPATPRMAPSSHTPTTPPALRKHPSSSAAVKPSGGDAQGAKK